MKSIIRFGLLAILSLMAVTSTQAQKKVQQFTITRIIDVPAEKVWAVAGEDYGAVANSHPKIISSKYIGGSLMAKEGAERVCNFNKKGTKYLHEKLISYDAENMTFTNQVYQSGKFPVDPAYTKAVCKVTDLGDGTCKISYDMQYRTKPGFMGALSKGKFKKLIKDYFISIEHHVKTGEVVNKDNFKGIKKKYS